MILTIQDDFDLKKIQISGQCFRVKETEPGVFRFITGEHVVYIKEVCPGEGSKHGGNGASDGDSGCGNGAGDGAIVCESGSRQIEISCNQNEWKRVWAPYFDMGRSYAEVCRRERGKHDFTDKAIDCGQGLRILKQDKWEMLISFIISQRKSIPAISSAVEAVSKKFGTCLDSDREVYAFPAPEQMASAALDDLKECGLGYRAPYVLDAIHKVLGGELDLDEIDKLDDEALFQKLMEVHGVGMKVSNCVCLFAYARMGRAPVDVWIARAIDEEFGGVNPFPEYGENAGIIQQYIFYYMKNH